MDAERRHDPADPLREPVAGVSLERYAQISALLLTSAVTEQAEIESIAEAGGVPRGAWPAVQREWVERMRGDEALRAEYRDAYWAAQHGNAGVDLSDEIDLRSTDRTSERRQ